MNDRRSRKMMVHRAGIPPIPATDLVLNDSQRSADIVLDSAPIADGRTPRVHGMAITTSVSITAPRRNLDEPENYPVVGTATRATPSESLGEAIGRAVVVWQGQRSMAGVPKIDIAVMLRTIKATIERYSLDYPRPTERGLPPHEEPL